MTYILLYAVIVYLVAHLGRDRKFGFWGTLAVAVLLTPVIGLLTVFASDARAKPPRRCIRHDHT